MLGGKVRLMPCGAAPFDYKVLQFFRAALGAAVLEVIGNDSKVFNCHRIYLKVLLVSILTKI